MELESVLKKKHFKNKRTSEHQKIEKTEESRNGRERQRHREAGCLQNRI